MFFGIIAMWRQKLPPVRMTIASIQVKCQLFQITTALGFFSVVHYNIQSLNNKLELITTELQDFLQL